MKTPTPSQFPVLDNRPIDQWKVTELKEELKRRRLTTRGLKEELVRRLDEALRMEMDPADAEGDNDNGVKDSGADQVVSEVPVSATEKPVTQAGDFGVVASGNAQENLGYAEENVGVVASGFAEQNMGYAAENIGLVASGNAAGNIGVVASGNAEENLGSAEGSIGNVEEIVVNAGANTSPVKVSINSSAEQLVQDESVEEKEAGFLDESVEEKEAGFLNDPNAGMETPTDIPYVAVGEQASKGLSSGNAVDGEGLRDGLSERKNGDSEEKQRFEDVKPPQEDVKLDSSVPNNQVSEVSTSLGFPVKSNNSISTDSVSLHENNDLKDNIIADNVKLESDVKPEMVQPSSSDSVPDGDRSLLRDVDESHEYKVSVEGTDNTVENVDISQKNYSADLGSSEKLNLDRSSGDDSMEEDASESKQIDSNYNTEEVGEKTEKSELAAIKSESPVAAMDTDVPVEIKGVLDVKNDVVAISADKRKLSDQEAALNNKPAKRQHRWKTESNNLTEPQMLDIPLAPAKDVPHSVTPKRIFSRSNSMGADDPPKEREVPPSAKPSTNSLRIDRFLRPFTLKAVQELLGKTGTVTSFWMDHIKTHCYVTYSSVEEAVETRNAVYNLQWPPNGGRQLLAEFVDPEEVKLRLEPPPPPPAPPVNSAPIKAAETPSIPQPSPRQLNLRQQMAQQPTLPPPPPLSNPPPVREWAHAPPPVQNEKVDAPILTLDDLFKKTKATPRIYYLPLSEEQVAAVLEERRNGCRRKTCEDCLQVFLLCPKFLRKSESHIKGLLDYGLAGLLFHGNLLFCSPKYCLEFLWIYVLDVLKFIILSDCYAQCPTFMFGRIFSIESKLENFGMSSCWV